MCTSRRPSIARLWGGIVAVAATWDHGPMDITKMLAELRAEREHVEQPILVLERVAGGRGKRRGRPPKWMVGQKRRGRPPGSKNKPKVA